ncbi:MULTISPECIES: hypothetical protein [Pontibacillus]|uniref:Uncharacterized protein n=1 Tax=Pontibacillus chungwhensis TaxID=265426 RepID=A0ABY8UY83_9BACI|nr:MULTISPECIES: hypothetical protein [Pontibacillus]MCD5323224.1 hypothetical protein [Pontibacillus sp. HN14]WIF96611.1 hypothetical protein QNI29_12705 [Pontibacillus chungwhensis]
MNFSDQVVSVKKWLLYLLLLAIPVVNLVTIFVLAFGNKNETVRNYGKASLLLMAIIIVLMLLIAFISIGLS